MQPFIFVKAVGSFFGESCACMSFCICVCLILFSSLLQHWSTMFVVNVLYLKKNYIDAILLHLFAQTTVTGVFFLGSNTLWVRHRCASVAAKCLFCLYIFLSKNCSCILDIVTGVMTTITLQLCAIPKKFTKVLVKHPYLIMEITGCMMLYVEHVYLNFLV